MGRQRCAFKQSDVVRAIKAGISGVTQAGLEVACVKIDHGGTVIIETTRVASVNGNGTTAATTNEWDEVYGEDKVEVRQ
jgi:hypothetical protein